MDNQTVRVKLLDNTASSEYGRLTRNDVVDVDPATGLRWVHLRIAVSAPKADLKRYTDNEPTFSSADQVATMISRGSFAPLTQPGENLVADQYDSLMARFAALDAENARLRAESEASRMASAEDIARLREEFASAEKAMAPIAPAKVDTTSVGRNR